MIGTVVPDMMMVLLVAKRLMLLMPMMVNATMPTAKRASKPARPPVAARFENVAVASAWFRNTTGTTTTTNQNRISYEKYKSYELQLDIKTKLLRPIVNFAIHQNTQ